MFDHVSSNGVKCVDFAEDPADDEWSFALTRNVSGYW